MATSRPARSCNAAWRIASGVADTKTVLCDSDDITRLYKQARQAEVTLPAQATRGTPLAFDSVLFSWEEQSMRKALESSVIQEVAIATIVGALGAGALLMWALTLSG
jgi:hypothetical protein